MRKKKEDKNRVSLSILKIHDDKMNEFNNKNDTIKKININIKDNLNIIDKLNKEIAIKRVNDINCIHSTFICDNNDKIIKYTKLNSGLVIKLDYLSSGREETDYILNSCNIIHEYMVLEENEKNMILNETKDIEQELYELNTKKTILIDQYMFLIDSSYVSSRSTFCIADELYCDNCNIILTIEHGFSVCYNCGKSTSAVQHPTEPSFKEMQEMDLRTQYTYEKATHLSDWLRRFQAKEHKDIPQSILDQVVMEAHKQKVRDLSELTESDVKKYLKNLNLNEYYDNVISIINKINKRQRFILTPEVEQKIKDMFQQTCILFVKHKGTVRKNMLSYSYLLNKYMLILGLPEFSKYFFLLKSPEKLREQDHIFKKIVDELARTDKKTNWRFFPSL